MLCMRCKTNVSTSYFVSKEEAKGTLIQGPLVCQQCYVKTFPGKPLPRPIYVDPPRSPEPVRLGSQLDAGEPNPIGMAFVAPPRQAARTFSVDDALQFIADGNRKSMTGFTWGPIRFNQAWAESIEKNEVITYALTIPKDCEQGLGVYLATTIWKSCSYGNTDDTSVLMVTCANTPMLDYSSTKEKDALAQKVSELTGVTITGVQLTEHLSAKACRVRAIKQYGNYFALTTGENVTATFDAAAIKRSVSAPHLKIVSESSYPHAKNYLAQLFSTK